MDGRDVPLRRHVGESRHRSEAPVSATNRGTTGWTVLRYGTGASPESDTTTAVYTVIDCPPPWPSLTKSPTARWEGRSCTRNDVRAGAHRLPTSSGLAKRAKLSATKTCNQVSVDVRKTSVTEADHLLMFRGECATTVDSIPRDPSTFSGGDVFDTLM